MPRKRKILIADPDRRTTEALDAGLRRDFHVLTARDGSKALELSITEGPDLIMFYRRCPLISAKQFLRILRTNPRTEHVPLIILSDESLTGGTLPGYLEGVLVKPLNLDEVHAHVTSVFERVDAAREVTRERGAVQGSLEQISMVDLLQVFAMNRRSGCIRLSGGPSGDDAEVFVADGQIEDAKIGNSGGEKALYRLLAWQTGTFNFVPGINSAVRTIFANTDSLLMEGMRQGDELSRLQRSAPGLQSEVKRLITPEEVPDGLHAVTAEIFELLRYYSRVGDLVDRAQATDLEVYLALQSLLSNGLIRVVEPSDPRGAEPLLSQDEVFDVFSHLRSAGLSPTFVQRPKIGIMCESLEDLNAFSGALTRLPEFSAANLQKAMSSGFGAIGDLVLSSGFAPGLFAMSSNERMLPFSHCMFSGTIAVIAVLRSEALHPKMLSMFDVERRAALLNVKVGQTRLDEPEMTLGVALLDEFSVRDVLRAAFRAINATELREITM